MSGARATWRVMRRRSVRTAPYRALVRHPPTLFGRLAMERWMLLHRAVPFELVHVGVLRAASLVDCEWCVDIGIAIGRELGMERAKIEAVADWQGTALLTADERLVAEYADALSRTPVRVSDDLDRRVGQRFSPRQRVALTEAIAWEHTRARFNAGLRLRPEGYAEATA